jgi:hypothetical protein
MCTLKDWETSLIKAVADGRDWITGFNNHCFRYLHIQVAQKLLICLPSTLMEAWWQAGASLLKILLGLGEGNEDQRKGAGNWVGMSLMGILLAALSDRLSLPQVRWAHPDFSPIPSGLSLAQKVQKTNPPEPRCYWTLHGDLPSVSWPTLPPSNLALHSLQALILNLWMKLVLSHPNWKTHSGILLSIPPIRPWSFVTWPQPYLPALAFASSHMGQMRSHPHSHLSCVVCS